jgi:yeast amino acid transporter
MTLWTDRVPDYGWILMAWAFSQTISLLGVAMYGESKQPQRFSLRKLTQISGILAGLFQIPLCALQFPGRHPNQHRRHWRDYIGFRYWKDPGLFVNGINGFGQTFLLAAVY